MSQNHKILIIGQGLAGTVLAHQLLRKNFSVTVLDKGHKGISTSLAAGVINPVTGRRIVKSWLIDDLLPVAKRYYQEVGAELGISLWYELPALRLFTDTAMSNNWGIRMQNEGYGQYLDYVNHADMSPFPVKTNFGAGVIRHSARANISLMITRFREKWREEGRLIEAAFRQEDLAHGQAHLLYQGESYDKIIFCEGWEAMKNPFFVDLPFQVTKGEVLILRIPEMPQKNIIKKKVALVPLGQELFWAGATNYWKFEDVKPTQEGKSWLKTELESILDIPYEVVDHLAAIRPTVRHRRPIMGFPSYLEANNVHAQIGLFNGFGTKGTSLVPFWAGKFISAMLGDAPLDKEVDVNGLKHLNP
ncbi:MAG TPA: FAD-binding oxidoreductase [Saprospiraceae bacterium]|nr:FAD-binding oxidoreductase [Saprospiraceae bacterium]